MSSPYAFLDILHKVILASIRAHQNGKTITFEDHSYEKAETLAGADVDHHGKKGEHRWGLHCATTMAAMAKHLEITEGLTVVETENPDADQRLAYQIMALPLIDVGSKLDHEMSSLLKEEFACFCEGNGPEPERQKEIVGKFIDVCILIHPNRPPIALIQHNSRMLPFRNGSWNHIVALAIQNKLSSIGKSSILKNGLVTITIHGDEINDPAKNNRFSWQKVVPSRLVCGIVAINNLDWSDQYQALAETIKTHEDLSEIIDWLYTTKIRRNLLITANSPKIRKRGAKAASQHGLRRLIRVLKMMGYQFES